MKNAAPADQFCELLERIDQRCAAADGPVPNTLSQTTPDELHQLYVLAQQIKHEHKIVEIFRDRMARFGNWDDGVFYYNGVAATELHEPLLLAMASLPARKRAKRN